MHDNKNPTNRKHFEENNYRFGTVQTKTGSYLLFLVRGESFLRKAEDLE